MSEVFGPPASWYQRLWRKFRHWWHGPDNFAEPTNPELVREAVAWFSAFLDEALSLPIPAKQQYLEEATLLFTRMTPMALRRVREHVQQIDFYPSLEDLTVAVGQHHAPVRTRAQQGRTIGGAYDSATGQMWLDGLDPDKEDDTVLSHYAHEFGHALDGPERQITSHALWKQAWREEICPQRMTLAALASPKEGLAEFARLLYTGIALRIDLERHYPLCVEVWKGFGLW